MKQIFYLMLISMVALSACTGSYKKGDEGLEYKIIPAGKGETIGYGNYMYIHIKQVYGGAKDTVLLDTRDYMPRIQLFDSANTPMAYYKILKQLRRGDSLIIRLLTDSAFKNSPNEMPPFMKKGKFLYTHVKMIDFYNDKNAADSAIKNDALLARPKMLKKQIEEIEKELETKKAQLDIDNKIIEDYLTKNNIKATKTKWGTYISLTTDGAGEKLDNNKIAVVNYTGRTLDSGKVFDSNIDPKFGHEQPYDVSLSSFGGVILGWTDALLQLKAGSKATVYIPSSLAYGTDGRSPMIKPNDILVFDMDIIGTTTEEEAAAKQKAAQEEMIRKIQEDQKKLPDPKK
ncbi:MAG: FKBP-type peptidyl-prolyl cis-trans isomerase [Chitinophagaceae bacterium]|nr:FKBP-type peptidyl-prolyl cis-trans isomerase [Chitinophagaceae bacterium]